MQQPLMQHGGAGGGHIQAAGAEMASEVPCFP